MPSDNIPFDNTIEYTNCTKKWKNVPIDTFKNRLFFSIQLLNIHKVL